MYRKYRIKGKEGNNICGKKIREHRLAQPEPLSQRQLAEKMQEAGIEMDKYVIMRIESGARYVTDVELKTFADFFGVPADDLLDE